MAEARKLEELADRVEKLTGPDRDVDGDIAFAVGATARKPKSGTHLHYTASLDAAMTLAIPTHHILTIEELPRDWTVKIGSRSNDREPISWAECSSFPRALTSAWLQARARAAQGEG